MGTDLFEKQGAVLLAQSDGCAVWQFRNETGDGTMTAYEVFPGVMLSFNDFHMGRFESSYVADRRLFAGRGGWNIPRGTTCWPIPRPGT